MRSWSYGEYHVGLQKHATQQFVAFHGVMATIMLGCKKTQPNLPLSIFPGLIEAVGLFLLV